MSFSINKTQLPHKIHEKENLINIYAFLSRGSVYVEVTDTFYNLQYVYQKVFTVISEDMLSPVIDAATHILLDRRTGIVHLTKENTQPMVKDKGTEAYNKNISLLKSIGEWIKTNPPQLGGAIGDSLSFSPNGVAHPTQDFSVLKLHDLKNVIKSLEQAKSDWSKFKDSDILLCNFSNKAIVEELEGQVGEISPQNDHYVSESAISVGGVRLSPPVLIINKGSFSSADYDVRTGRAERVPMVKNEIAVDFSVVKAILDEVKEPSISKMRNMMRQQQRMGYDVSDILFMNFSDAAEMKSVHDKVHSEIDPEVVQKMNGYITKFGIEKNDKSAINFLYYLMVMNEVFPFNDSDIHPKKFFITVSVPKENGEIPDTPAKRNLGLFNFLFSIVPRGVVSSKNKVYFLLESKFDIPYPQRVLSLFSPSLALDTVSVKDVFMFNTNNGILSKYNLNYKSGKATTDGEEEVFYNSDVMKEFPRVLETELGSDLKENRFNEAVSVKDISEFPYAFSVIKGFFDKEKIAIKPLQVIFISDPMKKEQLGGYVSKRVNNVEAISLSKDVGQFKLPFITLNIANKTMQYRENLSVILVHECRHFLDDERISQKKETPDYFLSGNSDGDMVKYLASKSETAAFSEEIKTLLSHYSDSYIESNWFDLKNRFIYDYLSHVGVENTHRTKDTRTLEEFSRIADLSKDNFIKVRDEQQTNQKDKDTEDSESASSELK